MRRRVLILSTVIREDFAETRHESGQRGSQLSVWEKSDSGREKSTSVEYLRSECGWKVPGKLGWPVYLKQHKRGGRLGDEV